MAEPGLGGRVLGGRYRLRSLLAVGGMGVVWAAEDAVLGREVAVKVLGDALAGDRRAALRLRREARAAGRLVHPAIARVLDLGEDAGRPYLVMELLHGESLAARLAHAGGRALRVAAPQPRPRRNPHVDLPFGYAQGRRPATAGGTLRLRSGQAPRLKDLLR